MSFRTYEDLKTYTYTPESVSDKIKILFTARMVEEKGVWVLVHAAELLRKEYEGRVVSFYVAVCHRTQRRSRKRT